jgi:hypothetical protein
MDLSPKQIVGVARKEGASIVSHERITSTYGRTKKGTPNCMNTCAIRVDGTATEGQKRIRAGALGGR